MRPVPGPFRRPPRGRRPGRPRRTPGTATRPGPRRVRSRSRSLPRFHDRSALHPAPPGESAAAATGGRGVRDVSRADRRRPPACGRRRQPIVDVHLPPVLPAVHRQRAPSSVFGPSPIAISASRTSVSGPGNGTSSRSRSVSRSSSTTPPSSARSPSTLARPAPPSRSCRWTGGRRYRPRTPTRAALARRRGAARPYPAAWRTGGVLPRADRRVLRTRRAVAFGVARVRRRHRGACGARRLLRPDRGPRAAGSARERAAGVDDERADVHRSRHLRRAVRRSRRS